MRLIAVLNRLKRTDILISVLVTLAGLVLFALSSRGLTNLAVFSFLHNVELRSLDARFVLRGTRPPDDRVVIVGIDEKTLRNVGAFPIPRDAYARLIDRLSAGGARVVAFDITFPTPEKNSAVEALQKLGGEVRGQVTASVMQKIRALERSSDNDAIFAASLKRAGTVILGHIFLDEERTKGTDPKVAEDYFNILWGQPFPQVRKVTVEGRDFNMDEAWARHGQVAVGIEPNIPLLAEAARSYGFFNTPPDSDGTLRRANLIIRYQDQDYFPSLDFQAVKLYEQITDQEIAGFLSENGLEGIVFGPHQLRTNSDATVPINFTGPYRTYPHYSMVDVLDGTVPAETFRDKIVLVGGTALGIGDIRSTPFPSDQAAYMGVEVHANIIDNLLHTGERGRSFLLRGFQQQMVDVAFLLIFGLGLGFVFTRSKPFYSTLAVLAALAALAVAVYFTFARLGWWISFVFPAGVLLANYAGVTTYRMIFEEREKRKIRKTFSQYVSPGVIRLIEENPEKYFRPGGELKELTIMFTDIRSFTSIAEQMGPDDLVFFLNEYLSEMTDIVFNRWGTLDKYIGDAIMAFWGSPYPQPDHKFRACACALEMQARLQELNAKWGLAGRKPLSVGVGISSGVVNVGNMGSSRRLSWTVMGDEVNLASRLEGLNKEYHAQIIVSEHTQREVSAEFVWRELDQIRVKGKLQPVGIYELLAFAPDAAKYEDLRARFHEALTAYRRQSWKQAIRGFEDVLVRYPEDGPSQVLLRRSQEFLLAAPSADWDGVYVATTK